MWYIIALILYGNKNLATAVIFACHVLDELNNWEGGGGDLDLDLYSIWQENIPLDLT